MTLMPHNAAKCRHSSRTLLPDKQKATHAVRFFTPLTDVTYD